jgi:hypothetical protein
LLKGERGRRLIAEPTLLFKQVNSSSTLINGTEEYVIIAMHSYR